MVEKGASGFASRSENEVNGFVVNEEVAAETEGWERWKEDGEDELDEEQVKVGRKEEKDFMVERVKMFELGSHEEAVRRGGKEPTTTKWVEGWKADENGGRFGRCRLVGRDFKMKGIGEREDLFAAMPPLESKKLLFRMAAGVRGQRRRKGLAEVN